MRTAYIVLAGLTLLSIVFQFITAGAFIGGLGNDGDWLDPHGGGSMGVHVFPLGMVIVGAIGKLGREAIGLAAAVLVLGVIQVILPETGAAFLHPLNALVLFVLAHRALHHVRGRAPGAEPIAA
jgi:hypothetical protein